MVSKGTKVIVRKGKARKGMGDTHVHTYALTPFSFVISRGMCQRWFAEEADYRYRS